MSTSETKAHKPDRWVWALIGSIALNGLLIGFLLASQGRKVNPPDRPPAVITVGADTTNPNRMLRALEPKRRRQIMHKALKEVRKQNGHNPRALLRELRAAKAQAMRIAAQEPLDIPALENAMQTMRALRENLAVQGDALMIEIMKQMTPEERRAVATKMRHQRGRKAERRQNRKRMQDE